MGLLTGHEWDQDVSRLNQALQTLAPTTLITVTNTNQDFLGELLVWFQEHFPEANPEVILSQFPQGYVEAQAFPFTAELTCPTFEVLARQVLYLFEVEDTETAKAPLATFLKDHLSTPAFSIDQTIKAYNRASTA